MHFLYYLNSYGKTIVLVSVPSPKRHNLQLFPACFPCPQNNCAMPLTHLWLLSIYIPSTFSSCTNSPQLRPLICLLLTCRSPYMHAFFPFLQFFHILSETLPCFGLLLQYCWPCLLFSARPSSLYICWAHLWSCQPTRNYFWNNHLISPQTAIFALIHRTGRANLFTNLYNCFFTFVQAFNSGFTAILNGAITLSSSVKALVFLLEERL